MGDFNQDLNRSQHSILYKYLISYNFILLIHTYHPHTPTWQCNELSSQIDEIWVPQQILHTFTIPTITHATGITDSDHHIIHTNLQIHTKPTKRNKKYKYKAFNYNTMTNELWEEFQHTSYQLSSSTTEATASTLTINQLWHQIQHAVLTAANTHIPFTFRSQKQFQNFSPTASKAHTALNTCGSILRTLVNFHSDTINNNETNITLLNNLNHKIQTIQSLTNIPITPLTQLDINSSQLSNTINIIKEHRKTLYHTRESENKQALSQHITQQVEKRYNNFTSNTTTMINSILNRHIDTVLFDNIKLPNSVITKLQEIRQHIKDHFTNWTKYNPYNLAL